jgi:hypothetical protein
MLHAFRIDSSGVWTHSVRNQEGLDNLVTAPASRRQVASSIGQENGAIRPLAGEPLVLQALEHFVYGRLRHTKSRSNVGHPRLAPIVDKIGDQLVAARAPAALSQMHGVSRC